MDLTNNDGSLKFNVNVEMPLEQLHQMKPDELMRPVDVESDDFKNLVKDIEERGMMNPIQIYQKNGKYIIAAGNHRFMAAKLLGFKTVQCKFYPNLTEPDDIFAVQVSENIHRIQAKRGEIANRIHLYAARNPTLNQTQIAAFFNITQNQVSQFLNLARNTTDEVKKALNDGSLSLVNAIQLSKLPLDEQNDWLDRAQTQDTVSFAGKVETRIANIRATNRATRANSAEGFVPVASLRKKNDILVKLNEVNNEINARELNFEDFDYEEVSDEALLGIAAGLSFALSLDAPTVTKIREENEKDEIERQQRIAQRKIAKNAGESADDSKPLTAEQVIFGKTATASV